VIEVDKFRDFAQKRTLYLFNRRYKEVSPYKSMSGYQKKIKDHLFRIEDIVEDKIKRFQSADTSEDIAKKDILDYLNETVLGSDFIEDLQNEAEGQGRPVSEILGKSGIDREYWAEGLSILGKDNFDNLVSLDEYKKAYPQLMALQKKTRSQENQDEDASQAKSEGEVTKSKDIIWIRSLCSLILSSMSREVYNDPELKKFVKVHTATLGASKNLLQTQALMREIKVSELGEDTMKASCILPMKFNVGSFFILPDKDMKSFDLLAEIELKYESSDRKSYSAVVEINSPSIPVNVPSIRVNNQSNMLDVAEEVVTEAIVPALRELREQSSTKVTGLLDKGKGLFERVKDKLKS